MAPVGQMVLLRTVDRPRLLRVMNLPSLPTVLAPVIGPPLGGIVATLTRLAVDLLHQPSAQPGGDRARMAADPCEQGTPATLRGAGFLLNAAAFAPLL